MDPRHDRSVLRREDGGIDLPSTMVSILVIAAFLAAAALAVFVVIPWAQDNAAKQLTGQVADAQSAYYPMSAERDPAGDPHYGTGGQLLAAGLLTGDLVDQKVTVSVENTTAGAAGGAPEDRFTVWVRSDTGRVFQATDRNHQPDAPGTTDPSFESGRLNLAWGSISYDRTVARSGESSLRIGPDAIRRHLWMAPYQKTTGGDRWQARIWYRTSADFVPAVDSKLRLFGDDVVLLDSAQFARNTGWTLATIDLSASVVTDRGLTRVGLEITAEHTTGTLWVDDADLVRIR